MSTRSRHGRHTTIDLATVRATLDYIREDLRLASEHAAIARHLDAAVAEIDALAENGARIVPLALVAQRFRRAGH